MRWGNSCAILFATLVSFPLGCAKKSEPRGVPIAKFCTILEQQAHDAAEMRDLAIAAYQTSVQDLEMGRKWKSGEVTTENRTGKYSAAERRGWQNALAGATWCKASEMLHGEVLATAKILDDSVLADAIAGRISKDCSHNLFSHLIVDDVETANKFVADARELAQEKARLEGMLVERCGVLARP